MEFDSKVFSSNIIRCNNKSKNNLYDILNIVPVQPLPGKSKNTINDICDFVPKTDKIYVPKKKTGRKVKTVRDIRFTFERDVYCYLPAELEKQRNILLRKIRYGSSRDAKTKELAINMLKCDFPVSKSAWQMLMNINPEDHKFSSQYILWKGRRIQVNGSKGGQHKFICKYDVGQLEKKKINVAKSTTLKRKKQLLHHSLNIKFKPGPLTKKKYLDDSYQKYQFGQLELVGLPKTGLEVQTCYGKPIAPVIETFISKTFFENNDLITQKWAEFAVSVLGKNENGILNQDKISEDSCVTFDLNYKCFQNRILMRYDGDIVNNRNLNEKARTSDIQEDSIISAEVSNVLDKVLTAVEVSLKQDEMYTGDDEPRVKITDNTLNTNFHSNNKSKRNVELRRLDVTVITISETFESDKRTCQKDYCTLGCICDSLKCSYNLKRHCGRIECMFNCKCDFSKYKYMNSFDTNDCFDIIPDLIHLDKTLGQKLAKEEHKFHQTVIVTDEKSILLKSDKRNWKASKKYADFYSNMHLKTERNTSQMLSIVCPNLDCKNVEPWCLVHNLYKCFCKGKFTETGQTGSEEIKTIENENLVLKSNTATESPDKIEISKGTTENMELKNEAAPRLRRIRQDVRYDTYFKQDRTSKESDVFENTIFQSICARVQPYSGRKYKSEYYKSTHKKISEMEKNDDKLRKRMYKLSNIDKDLDNNKITTISINSDEDLHKKNSTTSSNNNNEDLDKNKITTISINSDEDLHKNNSTTSSNNNNEDLDQNKSTTSSIDYCEDLDKNKSGTSSINNDEDTQLSKIEDNSSTLNQLLNNVIEQNSKDCVQRLSGKTKLVAWLESSYKQYKERAARGLIKASLDPPVAGRLCLYSWEFILSRYRERKNYFLITKQKPFRIFMAVNIKSPCFSNCSNISDISLSDIDIYPITVQNLLTNATDLKEHFCILNGLSHCWELIGSVTKVNESRNTLQELNETDRLMIPEEQSPQLSTSSDNYNLEDLPILIDDGTCENLPIILDNSTLDSQSCSEVSEENNGESKWFVMQIANDFTEIQFYKKGFFVKYESIVSAIQVARASNKTVRLSSNKCPINQKDPQFGIYAVPNTEDLCVFIGPYEKDEDLGIEAIKKVQGKDTAIPQIRTKGIWITTNKIDDMKVIDNPLLFLPPSCLSNDKMVVLDMDSTGTNKTNEIPSNVIKAVPRQRNAKKAVKQIKPIKIRKTNGFYHLTSNGYLKPILSPEKDSNNKSLLINTNITNVKGSLLPFSSPLTQGFVTKQNASEQNKTVVSTKPIAQIAPQIKRRNDNIYSPKEQISRLESGMSILKPEEINKRLFETAIVYEQPHTSTSKQSEHIIVSDITDEVMSMDIEQFLTTSVVQTAPSEEVYVISDDESDTTPTHYLKGESCKTVWIICKNIANIGWIAGKKISGDYLSFDFPGFKSSAFYPESEALKKISQIFARKVYVPKHIELQWQVVESEVEVQSLKPLDEKILIPEYILTKKGLRHKFDVRASVESSKESTPCSELLDDKDSLLTESLNQKTRIMCDLEETSQTLEEESSFLWDKTISRKSQLLESLSETTEELRQELTEQLNFIKFNNDD